MLTAGLAENTSDLACNKDNKLDYVWATSWGVSTRLIGALVMAHSDDDGLILPPRIAPFQVVIVPIYKGAEKKELLDARGKDFVHQGIAQANRFV